VLKKNYHDDEEEQVTLEGSSGATIRIPTTTKDGAPRFTMRRFEIKLGGKIGVREHPEEHEIYVLTGRARIFDEKGHEPTAGPRDVVLVPSCEKHGYENLSNETLSLVCIFPILYIE
jgi:quercetin dioxygenase-like cupin family protein